MWKPEVEINFAAGLADRLKKARAQVRKPAETELEPKVL